MVCFRAICEFSLTRLLVQTHLQTQTDLGLALFVTYTIIQSIMRSEMCSLHLTHPSLHTCSNKEEPCSPGSSRGLPVGVGIRTHNLGLLRVSSPTLYPLGQRLPGFDSAGIRTHDLGLLRVSSPTLYPLGQPLPTISLFSCSAPL